MTNKTTSAIDRAYLANLKLERDAIDAEIETIEQGIKRAAYDACMGEQLATVNDARVRDGKPPLTMSRFLSGCEGDEE